MTLSLPWVCRVGRDACSQIGAVCTERQEGSEKSFPARSRGSGAGSWTTSTLLTRTPAPFGLPKGHSPLITAAFCLGNTSWDVLSRVSRADHGLCQDLSLQHSRPGKFPRNSWRKRQTGSKCPGPGCPSTLSIPPSPLPAVLPQGRGVAQREGEMHRMGQNCL